MKPGDLVQRHSNLTMFSQELINAYEEVVGFNRKINMIWTFATNREKGPPFNAIVVPPNSTFLLLDNKCEEFYEWVKNARLDDPKNVLSTPIVKLLCNGEIIYTLAKWIEPVKHVKNMYF